MISSLVDEASSFLIGKDLIDQFPGLDPRSYSQSERVFLIPWAMPAAAGRGWRVFPAARVEPEVGFEPIQCSWNFVLLLS